MKRTPLKRKTPLRAKAPLRSTSRGWAETKPKPRAPLRARSKKREREDRERWAVTKPIVWARAKGRCELASPIAQVDPAARICSGPPEFHEKKKRGRGGSIVDPANVVLACHSHHRWTEDFPDLADEIGATIPSWEPSPSSTRPEGETE